MTRQSNHPDTSDAFEELLEEGKSPEPEATVSGKLGNRGIDRLSEKKQPKRSIDFQKFTLGSAALGWCIFLMFACIVLSIWAPDNELIGNGFEAFRVIVMTMLGYIFGSNNAKSN